MRSVYFDLSIITFGFKMKQFLLIYTTNVQQIKTLRNNKLYQMRYRVFELHNLGFQLQNGFKWDLHFSKDLHLLAPEQTYNPYFV